MLRCPKCNLQSAGPSQICGACGGILDEAPDDQLQADDQATLPLGPQANDAEPEIASGPLVVNSEWDCKNCGEIVPGNFEVCWKCMSTRAGERPEATDVVPELEEEQRPAERPEVPSEVAKNQSTPHCRSCGSTKLMRDLDVVEPGHHSDRRLRVVIFGNPDAAVFKDALYGEIRADVCAECGTVDFHVANPEELYQHFVELDAGRPFASPP